MSMAEPTEPFDSGRLDVGHGHSLWYEQVGNPAGTAALYLHGGPGSGCTSAARASFDPVRHRAVLLDQRAAGRSTPHASEDGVHWSSIDMDHHVGDIERLRSRLGIDRWIVFGISWGSVLGATYAERHPERVDALVLAAVSLGRRADIDWLTEGAGARFPEPWRDFRDHVPAHRREERLVEVYAELLKDPDPAVHTAAATAWCRWEEALAGHGGGDWSDPRYVDARFRLGFARQVTHCWRHDSWLADDAIVRQARRLSGMPVHLIHGALDVSSPAEGPSRLHEACPGSELILVDDEGHGGSVMAEHWRRVLADLA